MVQGLSDRQMNVKAAIRIIKAFGNRHGKCDIYSFLSSIDKLHLEY